MRRPARWLLGSLLCAGAGAAWGAELVSWDLSADEGGFLASGDTLQWEWGVVSSGPGAGIDGPSAWGTVLDGAYLHSATDFLQLPSADLSGAVRPVLEIDHWYQIDSGGDLGRVEVWNGTTWEVRSPVYGYPSVGGFSGASQGWTTNWFDLSGTIDASAVRLTFQSNDTAAGDGWYLGAASIYDGDNVPPYLEYTTLPEDTQLFEEGHQVEALVSDDQSPVACTLRWTTDRGDDSEVVMALGSGTTWTADIPAVEPDTGVCWWVEASDGANDTVGDTECFRVYLAAPTDLVGPDARVVGLSVTLDWTAPDSPYSPKGYRVYRDGTLVAETPAPPVDAPLASDADTFEVSAVFDTPMGDREGDLSEPLVVDAALSVVTGLEPARAWQGEDVRIAVSGDNLLLAAGEATLDLGAGIAVIDARVIDVNHAEFTIRVDETAAPGAREVQVLSGDVAVPAPVEFQVFDGADRPHLVSVAPDAVEQGEQVTLRISSSSALAACPLVDLGEGVVVEAVRVNDIDCLDGPDVWPDPTWIDLDVVVSNDAPIGLHDVEVDDGRRIWAGASLRVRDQSVAAQPVCGCASRPGPWLAWVPLCAAFLVVRRSAGRRHHFSARVGSEPRSGLFWD